MMSNFTTLSHHSQFYDLYDLYNCYLVIMAQIHPHIDIQQMHEKYNADMIPPDWNLAQQHAQACQPGRIIPQKSEVCPCCVNYIQKAQIPYWQDNKELAFLGEGFPLFYNFLKFCMIMLCILILDNCSAQVLINVLNYNCTSELPVFQDSSGHRRMSEGTVCADGIANQVSTISTDQETRLQILLKVVSFIAQIFVLLYFRQQQSTLANYLDERNTTLSDYSLYLDNVPEGLKNYEKLLHDLIDFVNTKSMLKQKDKIELKEVLIIEDIKEHYILEQELLHIVQLQKNAYKNKASQQEIEQLAQKYEETQRKIVKLGEMMEKHEEKYFLGSAFMVFQTQVQKDKAIEAINDLSHQEIEEIFNNYSAKTHQKLLAEQAPEAREVNWENIHYTHHQRYLAIFLGWLLFIVILVVIFIAFFLLIRLKSLTLQSAVHDSKSDPVSASSKLKGSIALSYILIIIINVFNKYGMAPIAHHITDHERHIHFSNQQYSFAMKYMLGMFFTTALMTLAVEAYLFGNFSGQYGVVEEELFMFIFNAFFSPIMWLINPYHIIVVIKRKIYVGSDAFTQRQANHMLEYPHYDMGKRYAQVMKTMWFTFLYVELIPAGALFSLVGILCYYVVDKYVLLRRSSVKESISSDLSTSMIRVLQIVLILKPAGQLFFNGSIRGILSIDSLVMVILGCIYIVIPWDYLLQHFFNEDFFPEDKTYDETRHLFVDNYISCYPMRKHKSHLKLMSQGTIKFKTQNSIKQGSPLKNKITSLNKIPEGSQHQKAKPNMDLTMTKLT